MPLPATTSGHRPPPLCEPRRGSSPLIRIRRFTRKRERGEQTSTGDEPPGLCGRQKPRGQGTRARPLSQRPRDRSERKHASRSSGSRASNRCSCFSWRGETIPPQAPHPLLNSRSAHFEAWAIACPNHSFGVGGLAHSGRSSEPRRLGGCEPVPQMARNKDGGSEASTRAGGG